MNRKFLNVPRLLGYTLASFGLLGCAAKVSDAAAPLSAAAPTSGPLMLQPTLLDAAIAFKFAARLKDTKTIEVRYQIAPGYYVYKDKFRATVRAAEQPSLGALPLSLPAGAMVDDPGFGRVETYRQVVFFDVPLSEAVRPAGVQLQLNAQGCADVGVCYAPQRYSVKLATIGDFVVPAALNVSLIESVGK